MTGNPPGDIAAPLYDVDHRLLEQLLHHRVLTTDQAAVAVGIPVRTARYRLARLRALTLVERERPGRPSGSAPHHWWLTSSGHDTAGSPVRIRAGEPSRTQLLHAAATAAVPLALAQQGPSVGLELLAWDRDRAAWEPWVTSAGVTQQVTPDGRALVNITATDALLSIHVEVDRATMPQQRLRDKMTRYVQYATDHGWSERHNRCPVLLVFTTTVTRARGILDGVHQAEPPRDLLVAVSATVSDPRAGVREPVWRTTADQLPRTLTGLLTEPVPSRREPPF